eukprot:CAMPEP_0185787422 /NCGR_PEP_ID=MMETSP1174-20130828/140507_1 /TAXON_ID=35687 /ORGANISM="Dictyocha speculum, Strain CCMP1381" /LENGTH=137 /DNA_ID=CAMNT_0028480571 /DNA_START=166 /DNA_END=576 /DNA_ORIENTATION=+
MISVDRSDLLKPQPPRPEHNALMSELHSLIEVVGPITVSNFMTHALQHPLHGYYTSSASQIGRAGDFVTAPEISQLFGEMVGIWCVATWTAMGAPAQVNLVEMGPGKGTLMKDILRVARRFPSFHSALSIHFMETSE